MEAALKLFAQRGYDGTGIEDIGQAVKISGPAIYRHFASKEEILITAFEGAGTEMVDAFDRSRQLEPLEALAVMVRSHASMAVNQGPWVHMWLRERHHLPRRWSESTRKLQLNYLAWFAEVIGRLRPELSPLEREEMAHAVIGMLNSGAFYRSAMPVPDRIEFLIRHAMALVVPSTAEPKPSIERRPRTRRSVRSPS